MLFLVLVYKGAEHLGEMRCSQKLIDTMRASGLSVRVLS